jgi:hypothetical protein
MSQAKTNDMELQQNPQTDPDPRKRPSSQDIPGSEGSGREGGDESLAQSAPTDSRLDEKVIVNEQRGDKITNAPSQSGAHTSEVEGSDDEILDG